MAAYHDAIDLWLHEPLTPYEIYAHEMTRILAHRKTPYQGMRIVEAELHGKSLVLNSRLIFAEPSPRKHRRIPWRLPRRHLEKVFWGLRPAEA